MNTERRTSLRLPLLAIGLAIVIACSSDTHVGCSPTLTCSLRQARFAPPPAIDAGPQECDLSLRRCAAAQVSAGGQHTCVVTDNANLLCWGDDSQGQRGITLDDPTLVHANDLSEGLRSDAAIYIANYSRVLDGAKQVAAGGQHTCALLEDGSVQCWGRSAEGQVDGRSDRESVDTPVNAGVSEATQIDAGASHTCAVVPEGVVCWGSGRYAQVGQEQRDAAFMPGLVPGTQGAVEVACGVRHTCARLGTQAVVCWGELFDETGAPYVTALATPVPELTDVLGITAGAGHNCALKQDFSVVCWGNNASGQLGDASKRTSAKPVAVVGLESGAGQVAAGGGELNGHLVGHSCAIDRSAQVACWGRDAEAQLGIGIGDDSYTPHVVLLSRVFSSSDSPSLGSVERIELGAFHSCSVGSHGSVFCWGDNTSQQLGASLRTDDATGQMMNLPVIPGRAMRVPRFGPME